MGASQKPYKCQGYAQIVQPKITDYCENIRVIIGLS